MTADLAPQTPAPDLETRRRALLREGYFLDRAKGNPSVSRLIARLRPMTPPQPLKRFGPARDGGYLMPDDWDGIGACISPGVSVECGFDFDVAALGIDVHMADASVEAPPAVHERFHFTRKFLETYESATTTTLDAFCRDVAPGRDLVLQMDIEGAEYRVINSASPDLMARFRMMAIEFHDLHYLFTRFGQQEIGKVFDKILQTHQVVHIHPNNVRPPVANGSVVVPPLLEFTFHRRDRGPFDPAPRRYPHPLDAPCVAGRPNRPLPECWW